MTVFTVNTKLIASGNNEVQQVFSIEETNKGVLTPLKYNVEFDGKEIGTYDNKNFDLEHIYLIESWLTDKEFQIFEHEEKMLTQAKPPFPQVSSTNEESWELHFCKDYLWIIIHLYFIGQKIARNMPFLHAELSYFMDKFNRYEIE